MGTQIRVGEISNLVIYFVLITMCCDNGANCDSTIHAMRQRRLADEADFQINATELDEHIMRGLNMTKKPDIELVSTPTTQEKKLNEWI